MSPLVGVLMGVSGSGKTTVGRALAQATGCVFEEGDDLHPASNVAKMRAGIPLTDADRAPWLAAVGRWIDRQIGSGRPGVVACSALRRAYRDQLRTGRPEVRFILLHGEQALLQKRIASRTGHFMPASLLESQLATLEAPGADERPVVVDIDQSVDAQVAQIRRALPQL